MATPQGWRVVEGGATVVYRNGKGLFSGGRQAMAAVFITD
jgi:hypothetical protein